jgi:hypothetical protein
MNPTLLSMSATFRYLQGLSVSHKPGWPEGLAPAEMLLAGLVETWWVGGGQAYLRIAGLGMPDATAGLACSHYGMVVIGNLHSQWRDNCVKGGKFDSILVLVQHIFSASVCER